MVKTLFHCKYKMLKVCLGQDLGLEGSKTMLMKPT